MDLEFFKLISDPQYKETLLNVSSTLSYPPETCDHLRQPNFGDLRSPLLTDIKKSATSCLLCLAVSTVVAEMLPELAALNGARVRLDSLGTLGRAKLCIAASSGETGRGFREKHLEVCCSGTIPRR